jgi:hypothetical protein
MKSMQMKIVCSVAILLIVSISAFSQVIGGMSYEKAFDMIDGEDGYVYLAGFTGSYGNGNRDGFVIKYNSTTSSYIYNTWGKTDYDEFRSICKTNDGFLLTGFSFWREGLSLQAIIAGMNSQLDFQWSNNFGNWHYQHAYKSIVLSDGSFLVGGIDRSIGLYGPYLIKTNSTGTAIWEKSYTDYQPSHIVDIYQKNDGNIVLLCSKGGFFNTGTNWHSATNTDADILFIELNSEGNVIRDKQIYAEHHDIPVKFIADGEGNFYVLSHSQSYSENKSFDICLSLINSEYEIQWTKTYGGDDFEYASDFEIDTDGNIHIVGTSASANDDYPVIWYLKTDNLGNLIESEYLLPEARGYGASLEIIDTSIYLLGTTSKNGNDDYVLFINNELDAETEFVTDLLIYPNPVTDFVDIQFNNSALINRNVIIEIFDSKGCTVFDKSFYVINGSGSVELSLGLLKPGQFIVRISDENGKKISNALIIKI